MMAQVQVARQVGQVSAAERALLVLPALVGLSIGLFPLLLPKVFAQVAQFPDDDLYVYQLTGAATLGYGVVFLLGVLRGDWLELRLPTIGLLVFNVVALFVDLLTLLQGSAPSSVVVVMIPALLVSVLSSVLLYRYRHVPRPPQDLAMPTVRVFLAVGFLAAGTFGVLPLFAPELGRLAHLHINAPFIARQAGAASLGYAVMTAFAQRALSGRELRLPIIMAAIFNGVSGLVSIPVIFAGDVVFLPWLIAPVGLAVLAGTLIGLRRAWPQATPSTASAQV
jgi:hypothetical protein